MSLIQLHLSDPDLFKHGTVADVVDASGKRADYESNAPTGVSGALPSFTDIEAWEGQLIGLYTNTGQIVTPERAKRCATVLAIMRGLSEDVGCLPQPLYKRGEHEDTIAAAHPVHQMLNVCPNDIMTPLEVREHMMMELMTYGLFFNLKNETPGDWENYGQVTSLWPLQAAYVTRRYRELVWTFTDPTTGMAGSFTPDLVWRGSILSTNGIDGFGITTLCKEAIGMLLAAEQQGARLFSHGIQTDFVLESDGEVGDEEKKDIRTALMKRHAGSDKAFMPMILEGGMKASKLGLTAQESQYLEARGFQVAEIARVFRYPEVLLGTAGKNSKSATYASAESFFESYTKHTLGPWTTRLEQTAHRDLLTTKERAKYYTLSDFSGLLKANETARIANHNAKIQGGYETPAEARKDFNMPYRAELDYFTKPAGSTGTAGQPGPQSPDPTPTDQSAHAGLVPMSARQRLGGSLARSEAAHGPDLAARIACHLFTREQKAIVANKQEADSFYTNFGTYIEALTGADGISVRRYLEMRRNTPEVDRFTIGVDAALSALTSLCKG